MDAVQGVIEQLRGDPVLRKVLDSPKMQRVLEEMQKDPAAAMQRHAGDREVMAVLAKLTTFDMSRAQRRAIQDLGASPDELAKSIYGNRQLAIKLQQPHVRAALAEFRVDEQAAAAKYEGNAEINEVLDLLEASLGSGVIDV